MEQINIEAHKDHGSRRAMSVMWHMHESTFDPKFWGIYPQASVNLSSSIGGKYMRETNYDTRAIQLFQILLYFHKC